MENVPVPVTFILDEEGNAEYFRTRGFVASRVTGEGGAARELSRFPARFRALPPGPMRALFTAPRAW